MTTILINIEDDIKTRIDVFLTKHLENKYPRNKITSFIEEKSVFVNNKKIKSSYKLKLNDEIEYNENELFDFLNPNLELKAYNFELDIKYEDNDIIIVNKPKEMLTHPTKYDREKTLVNALIYKFGKNLSDIGGNDRQGIVHRLDRNTAGLIVVAKTNEAHNKLIEQIKKHEIIRKYKALALQNFETKEGIINKPLVHYLKNDVKMMIAEDGNGQEAITKYKVLEEFIGCSLVELELVTGRTHQIRAHLSSINHPVFGDSLYCAKSFMRNEFYNLKTTEQLLQSYFIGLKHPKTNKYMEFQLEEKDFSKDFIKVLNFLRSKNEH